MDFTSVAASLIGAALRMYTEYRREADRNELCIVRIPCPGEIIASCDYVIKNPDRIKWLCSISAQAMVSSSQYYCRQTPHGFCVISSRG